MAWFGSTVTFSQSWGRVSLIKLDLSSQPSIQRGLNQMGYIATCDATRRAHVLLCSDARLDRHILTKSRAERFVADHDACSSR